MRTPFETHISSETLCDNVEKLISNGGAILPLIGAGISVPSGLPTSSGLLQYLKLCVIMSLGLDGSPNPTGKRWHPRRHSWPSMRGEWAQRASAGESRLQELIGKEQFGISDTFHEYLTICRQAYGSLTDWRMALQFIARIVAPRGTTTPENQHPSYSKPHTSTDSDHVPNWIDLVKGLVEELSPLHKLALGEVEEHVIDSFFAHIVANKIPNMGHRMLAHFTHALRTRLVLSLNFDDLLEQAYREAGYNPTIFDIHYDATLPPWSLLGRPPAIVKLHGGRYGLRADLSLDQQPSETDRKRFRSYLLADDWREDDRIQNPTSKPIAHCHLLVAGVSGKDRRVRLLVEDAIRHFHEDLRIYWCCYSDEDENTVQVFFGKNNHQVKTLRHTNIGALLWEMYQRVTRCLPPGGLQFPTQWQLPSAPYFDLQELNHVEEKLESQIREAQEWFAKQSHLPLIIEGVDYRKDPKLSRDSSSPAYGITAMAWRLFEKWNSQCVCIWLDSTEVRNLNELKERILQAVACRLGRAHLSPPIQEIKNNSDHRVFCEELKAQVDASGSKWIIFLNFRDSHGYNADPFGRLKVVMEQNDRHPETEPDVGNWIRKRRVQWEQEWRTTDLRRMVGFLRDISNSAANLFRVVLLKASQDDELEGVDNERTIRITPDDASRNWAQSRAQHVMRWIINDDDGDPEEKARWLRMLILFQQVRHQTALVSRAVLSLKGSAHAVEEDAEDGKWEQAWKRSERWLRVLVDDIKALRRMAGGFLWMHWEVREHIRYSLLLSSVGKNADQRRDILHLGIADWHMTFFNATKDPLSVFQAVYHRCRVAQIAMAKDQSEMVVARGALCEANNHLEAARASILTWGNPLDADKCLGGYFTVLCDLIEKEQLAWQKSPSDEDALPHRRNLRFLLMVKFKAKLYYIWLHRDLGNTDKVLEAIDEFKTWERRWKNWKRGDESVWDIYSDEWNPESFWNINYLELEQAIACISLRNYRLAMDRLESIAKKNDVLFPIGVLDDRSDEVIWKAIKQWASACIQPENASSSVGNPSSSCCEKGVAPKGDGTSQCEARDRHRYSIRRLMVHVLRRWCEVRLLQVENLVSLSWFEGDHIHGAESDELLPKLHEAETAYLAATMLPRYVTEDEYSQLRVERSRINSIVAGVLAQQREFFAVHRRLNEASVALAHLPESEDSIARVVIGLRRVYCKLEELRNLKRLHQYHIAILDPKRGGQVFRPENWQEESPKASAILKDIHHQLREISDRMARDRKSLWWWMTYMRYSIVCLEYAALLRLCRRDNWSDVDDDAATRDAERAIDIVHDVCRRVTWDVYQTARILISFHNVIHLTYKSPKEYPQDLKDNIAKAIVEAWQTLKRLIQKFDDKTPNQSPEWNLDPTLKKYVEKAKDRLRAWSTLSNTPLE